MLKNYLKVAIRSFRAHKMYSFINVLGLSVALACCFFILLWAQDEISYDRFHEDGDQIYRVMRHANFDGDISTTSSIPMPLAHALETNYPEITQSILMGWESQEVLGIEDVSFRVTMRSFGSNFFDLFSFPLILGDPESALSDPNSIAISESVADRFFGRDWRSRNDLVGTTFRLANQRDVSLSAIFEETPTNSSIQVDAILPIANLIKENPWLEQWGSSALRLFVQLRDDADGAEMSAKISGVVDEHVSRWDTDVFLQPISEMYLHSEYEDGVLTGGRIDYVRMFLLVAIFIVLIASINFMNLATARSMQRAREIGVRKSVGATRSLLAQQFLTESVVTVTICFAVAVCLLLILMPSFNEVSGKDISLSSIRPMIWVQFGALALLTGLLAGSYPALYLSRFSVIGVLQKQLKQAKRGIGLRKGLVVFQFIMSILLIVGTFTVYKQLAYIHSKDLGVDRDNVLYLDREQLNPEQYESFVAELVEEPGIINVGSANSNPLSIAMDSTAPLWEGKDPDDTTLFFIITVGYDLVETLGMDLAEGRSFSRDYGDDGSNFLINQKAAEAMGMDTPIGQGLSLFGGSGSVIGVLEDFHMSSLYDPIKPVVVRFSPESASTIFVKIDGARSPDAIASVERVFAKFNPGYPFNYRFLDDEFEESYRSEGVIGKLANVFSFVAILIACLGLFGLASFTAEQRRKEIGVRKVLGASVASVVFLLSRSFVILVIGAFFVAAPIAYIVMNNWLHKFSFHTELDVGVLLLAGIIALLIAALTVSGQSIRAAVANPVKSLRGD